MKTVDVVKMLIEMEELLLNEHFLPEARIENALGHIDKALIAELESRKDPK